MSVLVTKEAPDFTADAVMADGSIEKLTLSSFKGKYVVLFFYPLDFTFVCPSEIIAFHRAVDTFKSKNTEVIGVSVDSQRYDLGGTSPLLGDPCHAYSGCHLQYTAPEMPPRHS